MYISVKLELKIPSDLYSHTLLETETCYSECLAGLKTNGKSE